MAEGTITRQRPGVEGLSERIREAIVSGELSGEENLTQTSLAQRFGVSRTPMREVLRMLELEGLIDRGSNGRFQIAKLSLDHIQETAVIRIGLETTAIRLTVPALDNLVHAELEGLLAQIDRLAVTEDWVGLEDPHRRFHSLISSSVGPEMNELLDRLWNQAARYRRASFQHVAVTGFKVRQEEHRGLLDAVEAYDADRAAAYMAVQIARTAIEVAAEIDAGHDLAEVRSLVGFYTDRADLDVSV